MNVKVEKLEKNLADITVELDTEKVEEGITKAYNKVKHQVSMPGFRKGKVPQKMIEKQYGVEVFYEDAADFLIQESYPDAYDEASKEIEIVSSPKIQDIQLERGKNFVYKVQVAVKPEVTLGEYKGIEYTAPDLTVPDEEVEKELERVRELNSRRVPVDGRAAKEGDIVDIDFEGFVDGKDFQGGKAEGYILTLGSHSFIDTFEDQIAGHSVGDEFDVNVTFPEDYNAADLAGKPAVFKCKLNDIKSKELPEIDDEFASEVSEFETLEEYKADIRSKFQKNKEDAAKNDAEREIIQKVVDASEMDIPEAMVDMQAEQHARDFAMRMESQGIPMDQYLNLVGQTPEKFMEDIRPHALQTIKERLVLEAVAKAEGIEVTEEMVEEELQKMADMYSMEIDKLKELLSDKEKESMKLDIAVSKAADFLYENGVAVEKKEEPAEEAPAEEPAAEAEAPAEAAEEAAPEA
ncbi:MAG: trigger factor [Lachnospiraceae bacterium]|nr:trigger factor [Lachnospiraceae bacterium]